MASIQLAQQIGEEYMALKRMLIGSCLIMVLANYSFASENKVDVTNMTCGEFLELKGEYKPTAIIMTDYLNKSDKPVKSFIDVSGIDKIIPIIIEACKENPRYKFDEVVHSAWEDIKHDL